MSDKCPVCYSPLGTFTDDPIKTKNGTVYIFDDGGNLIPNPEDDKQNVGFTRIDIKAHIEELQQKRESQENTAIEKFRISSRTSFTSIYEEDKEYGYLTKQHIEELRQSTEKLLTGYRVSKATYFNYDAEGNDMGIGQSDWNDPNILNYESYIRALHIEDLRHPINVGVDEGMGDWIEHWEVTPSGYYDIEFWGDMMEWDNTIYDSEREEVLVDDGLVERECEVSNDVVRNMVRGTGDRVTMSHWSDWGWSIDYFSRAQRLGTVPYFIPELDPGSVLYATRIESDYEIEFKFDQVTVEEGILTSFNLPGFDPPYERFICALVYLGIHTNQGSIWYQIKRDGTNPWGQTSTIYLDISPGTYTRNIYDDFVSLHGEPNPLSSFKIIHINLYAGLVSKWIKQPLYPPWEYSLTGKAEISFDYIKLPEEVRYVL